MYLIPASQLFRPDQGECVDIHGEFSLMQRACRRLRKLAGACICACTSETNPGQCSRPLLSSPKRSAFSWTIAWAARRRRPVASLLRVPRQRQMTCEASRCTAARPLQQHMQKHDIAIQISAAGHKAACNARAHCLTFCLLASRFRGQSTALQYCARRRACSSQARQAPEPCLLHQIRQECALRKPAELQVPFDSRKGQQIAADIRGFQQPLLKHDDAKQLPEGWELWWGRQLRARCLVARADWSRSGVAAPWWSRSNRRACSLRSRSLLPHRSTPVKGPERRAVLLSISLVLFKLKVRLCNIANLEARSLVGHLQHKLLSQSHKWQNGEAWHHWQCHRPGVVRHFDQPIRKDRCATEAVACRALVQASKFEDLHSVNSDGCQNSEDHSVFPMSCSRVVCKPVVGTWACKTLQRVLPRLLQLSCTPALQCMRCKARAPTATKGTSGNHGS